MALSANTVVEVRTAGSDTNGGGFVTGASGTDYSQQDAKNTVLGVNDSKTDAVAVGTGVITSATANFSSAIVGNVIYLQGGTGALAAGRYQVTVFTSATSITVDRNVAAGTGITMNIGGALGSPGMAGGIGLVSGNIVYIKAGTYTVTSASANVTGGCFNNSVAVFHVQGYQTTRGDLGTQPLLQASGISTFTIITLSGSDSSIANISVDCAGLTSSRGFSARNWIYKCHAANCTSNGFFTANTASFIRCSATGCSAGSAFNMIGASCYACIAYNNTISGFTSSSSGTFWACIADSNTGASSDGFSLDSSITAVNCSAYGNGRNGFFAADDGIAVINCIAEGNGANGINGNNSDSVLLFNNATFNNTSGSIVNVGGKGIININPIALSASPFTDAPNQDFSLNNTAGAGADCREAGYPGVLPVGGTGFLDLGALQHECAGLLFPFFTSIGALWLSR